MPGTDRIVVHNPVGYPPKTTGKPLAERLESLDGKTIYLVDCRFDDSDLFLGEVQQWFASHMPGVRTVVKQLNNIYSKDDPETWKEIKENGDAAILGVGH